MCVMSLECVNVLDKLDCAMVVSICPGFVCLSRVSLVADIGLVRLYDIK